MSLESKDRRFSSEQEHLGKPDFTGIWQEEELGRTGYFRMFILKREPAIVRSQTNSSGGEIGRNTELIEGVTFDILGLSFFTGLLGGDSITFTQTYSESARKEGAPCDKIFYKGKYDEKKELYAGTFGFSRIEDAGNFNMTSGTRRKTHLETTAPLGRLESSAFAMRKN
jgi:hypothetical protein